MASAFITITFFALVHGFGDDEAGEVRLAHLQIHEMRRDYPERIAARSLRGARHGAHQSDIARTIDQPPAFTGDGTAQGVRRFGKGRVSART